jgi:hypothetical protein
MLLSVDQSFETVITKLNEWEQQKDLKGFKLIKLDIKALYPSIDPKIAIQKIVDFIDTNEKASRTINELKFSRELLKETLQFALGSNVIRVGDKLYKQIKGLPIGSLLSGLVADFYLSEIQINLKNFLSRENGDFVRYVDDFLVLIPASFKTEQLLNYVNGIDQDLEFVVEGEGSGIDYLQMSIHIVQNKFNRRWYRKVQMGEAFLNYWSNVPFKSKIANIINTVSEIYLINNTSNGRKEDISRLEKILISNHYPKWMINKYVERGLQVGEDRLKKIKSLIPEKLETQKTNDSHQNISKKNVTMIKEILDQIIEKGNLEPFLESIIKDVPPDGHCLLHCIITVLKIRKQKLTAALRISIEDPIFQPFLTPSSKKQLSSYLDNGIWNQNVVDLIPHLASKCLQQDFVIIDLNHTIPRLNIIKHGDYEESSMSISKSKSQQTPKNVNRKLNFSTGWFSQETPMIMNYPPATDQEMIILVLKDGHYRFVDVADIVEKFASISDSTHQGETNLFNLPCLVLPFTSDHTERQILKLHHKIFPERTFNIAFKSTTTASKFIRPIGDRSKKNWMDLDVTGAVYKLTCNLCNSDDSVATYIGETGRRLRDRLKEHNRTIKSQKEYDSKILSSSQVQKHMFNQHGGIINGDWKVEILGITNNIQERKVKEAVEIAKHRPTLNRDNGLVLII